MQRRNAPSDVAAMVMAVFPSGTKSAVSSRTRLTRSPAKPTEAIATPPDWPPDLFAVCGHLLNTAGAYQYLTPGGVALDRNSIQPEILLGKEDVGLLRAIGNRWRDDGPDVSVADQSEIRRRWNVIVTTREPVCPDPADANQVPEWWRAAIQLMIIADEACYGVGYLAGGDRNWIRDALTGPIAASLENASEDELSTNHYRSRAAYSSICAKASREVVCVLPKARTPEVGVTIRSLSQNLALLPPTGVVEGVWTDLPVSSMGSPIAAPLSLLLVPYPYEIGDEAINPYESGPANGAAPQGQVRRWNWFSIAQDWLPKSSQEGADFLLFIDRLIARAREQKPGPIHFLVFPEYALKWEIHEALVRHIQTNHIDIEAIISGSSDNCLGIPGNHVLTTQLFSLSTAPASKGKRKRKRKAKSNPGVTLPATISHSRSKHHRWRLEGNQIGEYGLSNLNAGSVFWEAINLARRRFHTHIFRDRSIFTTLICEDLARPEPCHQYIRALGPNLVFVLLMDGAQLPTRWSARQALSLADDPGSAVLTFTSRAFVGRSARRRMKLAAASAASDPPCRKAEAPCWNIGLWRDRDSQPVPLVCDSEHEAVLLTIDAVKSNEVTIDGRFQNAGWSYRKLGEPLQIALDRLNPDDRKLLDRFVGTNGGK